MNNLEFHLDAADHLLHQSKACDVVEHIRAAQAILGRVKEPNPLQLATIAGLLIDCGADLWDKTLVQEGLSIFEARQEVFLKVIQPASFYYNIANAKKSLHDIEFYNSDSHYNPIAISMLTDAKNYYWKAYRSSSKNILDPQLSVNLGNSLDQCARVVEALYWYNQALNIDPQFGMAHLNKGEALLFLNRISDTFTIAQLIEAKRAFKLAEVTGNLPAHLKSLARDNIEIVNKRLARLGWAEDKIAQEEKEHDHACRDSYNHDPYWRYCISNYLALNEHALYCQCVGSRRDDLSIIMQSGTIGGEFVLRLELLLNRIKSEYCFARALYYQSVVDEPHWDTHIFEGTFTELHDNEAVGVHFEFLRTSFRLCFGILDRITQGLSELYELADPNESLYFESFWRPQDQKRKGDEKRWDKINQQKNLGLVALYSIATDLNRQSGQWGFFKDYRNLLEHGLLVLRLSDTEPLLQNTVPKRMRYETVTVDVFKTQTLQMLQLTASAIFSFVFCVREEGIKVLSDRPSHNIQLNKKSIGKE